MRLLPGFLFLTLLGFLSAHAQHSLSTIKGRVESKEGDRELSGAVVQCEGGPGISRTVLTDDDGEFRFKDLPAGEYDLSVTYVGYRMSNIHVALLPGSKQEIKVDLNRETRQLSRVDVFGRLTQEDDLGARQKEQRSNNIVNVISARAMERSPDINAANVLQRMSGLTVQRSGGGDDAYPVIRGLDPRYNNTLINGVKIASPDDKSRFVSLSIVPSDLLGSIEVHKSLTPDMEGDAIGGTVNLVMKDAPDRPIFKVLGSVGYSAIFLDRKFTTFSKKDIQSKSRIEKLGPDYVAKPDDFSRSNLDFKQVTPLPTTIFSITAGKRFLKNRLGFLISETFQNQYYGSNSVFNQAAVNIHTSQPTYSDYANRYFSTQQLNNGTVLHLDHVFNPKNRITLTNVFLYSYLAQARTIIDTAILGGNGGRTVPGTGPVSKDYFSVTSRQLIENAKLDGHHVLSNHFLFDWTGVFSYAFKRNPDFADIAVNNKIDTVHTTSDIQGPYRFVTTPDYFDAISRIWQHNEDKDLDGLANLTYRTKINKKMVLELKAGGLYRHKTRYNIQDEYRLLPTTSSSGVKQIFSNIYTAQWTVYNSHGTFDYDKNNYRLFEDIKAGYGQLKLSTDLFELVGGVREEETTQGYTLNVFYPTAINGISKNYTDLLPSAMLKLKLSQKSNLRASYFKSIARPNYYDLVPVDVPSVSTANTYRGNPDLRHAVANNFDIRYELFPKEEEQIFAGVFYKKLHDPIELVYIDGTVLQPQNFGTATIYGAELQFTKYFGRFGVTGNYTYLHSAISSTKRYTDLSRGISKDSLQKRSLQGQVGNTVNLSLLYRDPVHRVFVQVAYEYIGKYLALVYPLYGYDYYQDAQSILALSAEKQLRNKRFTVFAKANNLLNTHTRQQINNLLVVNETTNFNFSLGLRYSR